MKLRLHPYSSLLLKFQHKCITVHLENRSLYKYYSDIKFFTSDKNLQDKIHDAARLLGICPFIYRNSIDSPPSWPHCDCVIVCLWSFRNNVLTKFVSLFCINLVNISYPFVSFIWRHYKSIIIGNGSLTVITQTSDVFFYGSHILF